VTYSTNFSCGTLKKKRKEIEEILQKKNGLPATAIIELGPVLFPGGCHWLAGTRRCVGG
jgi:hypothetical protein